MPRFKASLITFLSTQRKIVFSVFLIGAKYPLLVVSLSKQELTLNKTGNCSYKLPLPRYWGFLIHKTENGFLTLFLQCQVSSTSGLISQARTLILLHEAHTFLSVIETISSRCFLPFLSKAFSSTSQSPHDMVDAGLLKEFGLLHSHYNCYINKDWIVILICLG